MSFLPIGRFRYKATHHVYTGTTLHTAHIHTPPKHSLHNTHTSHHIPTHSHTHTHHTHEPHKYTHRPPHIGSEIQMTQTSCCREHLGADPIAWSRSPVFSWTEGGCTLSSASYFRKFPIVSLFPSTTSNERYCFINRVLRELKLF